MRRVLSVTPLVDIFCSVYLLETISSNILHVLVSGETSNLKVGLPRERRKKKNHGNAKRDLVPSTQTLKRTSSLHPLNNKPSFH